VPTPRPTAPLLLPALGLLASGCSVGTGAAKQVIGVVHTGLLLLPWLPVVLAAGMAAVGLLAWRRPRWRRPGWILLASLSGLLVGLGAFLIVCLATMNPLARQVTAWDPARSAPYATRLLVAPEGVHCDFHDVDVVGDHAVVVGEGSYRLLRLPLSGGEADEIRLVDGGWQPLGGLTLDSETDPRTGRTWFLDGPDAVSWAASGPDGRWDRRGRVAGASPPLHHVATTLLSERQQLVLITINAAEAPPDPSMAVVDLRRPDHVQRRQLVATTGQALPNFRDALWLPPLERFVLAPTHGDRLWLLDADTGSVAPWVPLPARGGGLFFDGQRLYVAQPTRLSVAVIDPVAGVVERRIPTQPAVRAIAVDTERGLLLTGSLATGTVLVQRLDSGWPVRAIGTVMPMMRKLELIPGRPEALLTTWGALYRLRYADPVSGEFHYPSKG